MLYKCKWEDDSVTYEAKVPEPHCTQVCKMGLVNAPQGILVYGPNCDYTIMDILVREEDEITHVEGSIVINREWLGVKSTTIIPPQKFYFYEDGGTQICVAKK